MKLGVFFRSNRNKTVVFVLGCQRSGTTMLQNIMERIPSFSVYGEGNQKAMERYRFRNEHTIKRLISTDRCQFVMFRPLNDIQYSDRHLALYPRTKALWIYRQYMDTINSAVKKWGQHQKNIVVWIMMQHNGMQPPEDDNAKIYNIYMERMSPETKSLIAELANQHMSDEDGAALLWYVRNNIYFDLDLQNDPRVLLVKYEDIVADAKEHVKRIFAFIGSRSSQDYSDDIFASSIGKNPPPHISPEIESVCKGMMGKLDAQYLQQLSKS